MCTLNTFLNDLRTDDNQYEPVYEKVLEVNDLQNIAIPFVFKRKLFCKIENYRNHNFSSNEK